MKLSVKNCGNTLSDKFTFPMVIQNRISTSTGKDRVSDKELILFINTEARLVVGYFAIWL